MMIVSSFPAAGAAAALLLSQQQGGGRGGGAGRWLKLPRTTRPMMTTKASVITSRTMAHPAFLHRRCPSRLELFATTDNDDEEEDDVEEDDGDIDFLQFDHLDDGNEGDIDLTDSQYTQVLIHDDLPCATTIRQFLKDEIFMGNDPRQPSASRFVWDPWVVKCGQGKDGQQAPLPGDDSDDLEDGDWSTTPPIPGERQAVASQIQYSLIRAQCNSIFSSKVFETLVEEITQLGRSIGCTSITPPWISVYRSGDVQNFHTDPTQGPMAFTLSVSTGYGKTFWGGETIMLRPAVLDYWRDYSAQGGGKETPSILRYLPPQFGRFTAFDGRIPHGVAPVICPRGSPLESRIVIHGWFAQPEICWLQPQNGAVVDEETQSMLESALEEITNTLFASEESELGRVIGYLAIRLDIAASGEVIRVISVCDTLVADPADFRGVVGYDNEGREVYEDSVADIKLTLSEALSGLYFPELPDDDDDDTIRSVVVPFDFF